MAGTLFGAGLTLSGAFGLGTALTRGMQVSASVRLAAGAAVLGWIVFALMLAGAGRPVVLLSAAALCSLLTLLDPPALPRLTAPWWLVFTAAIFALCGGVNALTPEIEADPNTYHLLPAADALRTGGFAGEISFYERLPQSVEMLYVVAYAAGGSPAARLVHFALLIATVPLIANIGRRFGLGDVASQSAAVFCFIAPVVQISGSSAFNDAALMLMTAATVSVLAGSGPVWLAGLLAGSCYGIKITGGIAVAAGLVWLLAERRFRAALVFGVSAGFVIAPWLIRNFIETGSPTAPFFNRLFPNRYFHASTEQQIATGLRSYGVSFAQRFSEVLAGSRLNGILGPAFAFLPLVLTGIRKKNTRILIALALILSVPWWLNAGTRFLMPALPFAALALFSVIPSRLIAPLLLLHALTVLPPVITLYAPRAWRLQAFPWRAALGLQTNEQYLQTKWDYRLAKLVEAHTGERDRILDVYGIHSAHIHRKVYGSWQSAESENALRSLEFARQPGKQDLFTLTARFEAQPVTGIRIEQTGRADTWTVPEIELLWGGVRLPNRKEWSLEATPNRWETPLAFDGNLASRWNTWQPTRPGQFLSTNFNGSESVDGVRVFGTRWDGMSSRMSVYIRKPGSDWISVPVVDANYAALDLRTEATRFVRKLGFTHIVIGAGKEGVGLLGYALANEAPEWGMQIAAEQDGVYVLKLKRP